LTYIEAQKTSSETGWVGPAAEARVVVSSPTLGLLDADDPAPVRVLPGRLDAGLLVVCDHAGRATPARLKRLGLADEALERHIAYDIGAAELSRNLARRLNATLIEQTYSRLVIDCNRGPGRADLIPETSDGTIVPGNAGLDEAQIQARIDAIHTPYHAAIAAEIDRAVAAGAAPALILIHSFTPIMGGFQRPWQVGVLHQGAALSLSMLALLQAEPDLTVGDNAPYAMDDIDYTAPRHAQARGLQYLELETRQDLIADAAGQAQFADLYARLIPKALAGIE
jgi:predicted N-formylglutamate amidohydrolase